MKKTNAARILDRLKIDYRLTEFSVDEQDLSARNAAEKLKIPPEQVFKTLVARGDKTGVVVVSIPGSAELDLKAMAKMSGNKKVELVPLKEIQQLTGYLRGAVSPLGMKVNYSCYVDQSAFNYSYIFINAGARGIQIRITPSDLVNLIGAVTGKLII